MIPRPFTFTKRDVLVGVLSACLVPMLGKAQALETTVTACEPLFKSFPPGERWYPILDAQQCRAAIAFAGRAYKFGALTKEEYDYVVGRARRRLLHFEDGAPDAA
jgi:hypothetical protein